MSSLIEPGPFLYLKDMKIIGEYLNGIVVIEPEIRQDDRGFFMESYNSAEFERLGLPTNFVQDNHSMSIYGVIRGMHFQWDEPMGKLLRVIRGGIKLVELDIRKGSPTYGQHVALYINETNNHIVWIPPGFANGFQVITGIADVSYKCTAAYNPKCESSICWNSFGAKWADIIPILSGKDSFAQTLEEWTQSDLSNSFSF